MMNILYIIFSIAEFGLNCFIFDINLNDEFDVYIFIPEKSLISTEVIVPTPEAIAINFLVATHPSALQAVTV
jgi:hypothetical protein